jgi:hypothetical protein
MSKQLEERVEISLPTGTLLVIFEYLARSHKDWRGAGRPVEENTFVVQRPDAGEQKALWHLECEIERTLPEVFSPNYAQLAGEWKRHLASS